MLDYGLDREDMELSRIDNCNIYSGEVRVDQRFENCEERL